MAGLTAQGFVPKTQEEVRNSIRARIAASPSLGENLNVAAESPLGQLVEIFSAATAELWAEAENVYHSAQILSAAGVALDQFVQRYRISREPAVASSVLLTLTGTPSTVVPAGSAVTLVVGDESIRWSMPVAATIGGGGTVDAEFRADQTGPVKALAGSTWAIDTPVAGWTSAANAADADPGRNVETDAELRARALDASRGGAASGPDGVRAAILQVDDVTETVVIENRTLYTDADGRPAKSFEAVVRGGTDAEIAAAIFARKPAGIETTTTVSGANQVTETVVDANGDNQTVYFSRPDEIDVYIEIDYEPIPGLFPADGATRIRDAILGYGEGLAIGAGVYPDQVLAAIARSFTTSAWRNLDIRMGLTASPVTAAVVPASKTQVAVFDSSRITVTKV